MKKRTTKSQKPKVNSEADKQRRFMCLDIAAKVSQTDRAQDIVENAQAFYDFICGKMVLSPPTPTPVAFTQSLNENKDN